MPNSSLKQLLISYETKRILAEEEAISRKKKLYSQNPRLSEIDELLNKNALKMAKTIISSGDIKSIDSFKKYKKTLTTERSKILNSLGLPSDILSPIYECNLCNDSGYVSSSGATKMCSCLKQKLLNLEYNKSNMGNLEKENFTTFNENYFSPQINKEKYQSDISPRENIKFIKNISQKFIDNFSDPNEKNLLFTGKPGLGKTFLTNCIAHELLKKGNTVLYQTSSVMLDSIIDYKFGKTISSENIINNILSTDLLIIDDLGTETINSLKLTELFNIINTRLLNQNNKITKTIISTNLSLQDLYKTYDERIISRLVGNYNLCLFFGDDIRFMKQKN